VDNTLALALDLGTSSVRATVYDTHGRAVPGADAHLPHRVATTSDGCAELDADELVEAAAACCERALAAHRRPAPAVVGVSTFWHSFLGVDDQGRAVTPVSMWADTRSVPQVAALRGQLDERAVHARTGCRFHTSYLPARLLWLAENQPERCARVRRWLSPGEYLFERLFRGGNSLDEARPGLGCSVSMASGTGLLNQETGDWDEELLAALPLRRDQLPPVLADDSRAEGLAPEFAARLPHLREARWLPARGDGACSNAGSGCVTPDSLALMVGTSGAMRVATAGAPGKVPFGLWHYRLDVRRHLVGGALSNGGNLVAWLRETLRLGDGEALEAQVAAVPPDGHGLTVLPFLMGERCPNWRGDARAAFAGLSGHTTPGEMARAALEAVAYRFAAIHDLLQPFLTPDYQVIASGKALAVSPTWLQILADVLQRPVLLSAEEEASSRGAALLALEAAGVGTGFPPPPAAGGAVVPNEAATCRYQEGRARHERLYQRLIAELW
jgi:gluconokinase